MLARLSEGLREEELERAHYITSFFLLGFESGHRQRRYSRMSTTRPDYIRYLAENVDRSWLLESPFFDGWILGWKFEPMREGDG